MEPNEIYIIDKNRILKKVEIWICESLRLVLCYG